MQNIQRRLRLLTTLAATTAALTLAGCGISQSTPPSTFVHPLVLQGQVFAGRNYMAGATVKLYVTQPDGTAANGTYTGSAKLLQTVTASTTGDWSLTGFTCSSPDQLYVTAEAGVPYASGFSVSTLANNPNSLMMTAIGDCGQLTSASESSNVTTVVTNEASTVAAVWALRNFISLNGTTVNITSDATNYAGTSGVGTPGNYAGLAHAFLNANAIEPFNNGNFVQYTHGDTDGTHGGLVPVQELNSLAYAQYLCTIGGDGTTAGDFSYCKTLFQLAIPPGSTTAPTNSLAAMLNIATYPTNNSDAILAFTQTPIPLSGQTGHQVINAGVYVPALTAFGTLTDDWSVALYFLTGTGATAIGQGSVTPLGVTIDANDDVFFSNPATSSGGGGNVIALNSTGQSLWTSNTDTTNLTFPRSIAADAHGNLWVVNAVTTAGGGFVEQINATTGATINTYPSTSASLYGIAVDPAGDVWYTANSTTTGQNLHELARNGTTYAEATFATPPTAPYQLLQVRPDANSNIWVAGYLSAGGAAVYLPNTGTATAPTYTAPLQAAAIGGASSTYGITVDASGNAYAVANGASGGFYKITATGTGASTTIAATNVATNPAAASRFMDTDGNGNIWYVDNTTGTKLYEYIPTLAATPTAFYPCYNAGTSGGTDTATSSSQTCVTGISTRFDLSIDSTGSIWVASYGNSGGGRIVQILGLAAPTVPLRAMGRTGLMP